MQKLSLSTEFGGRSGRAVVRSCSGPSLAGNLALVTAVADSLELRNDQSVAPRMRVDPLRAVAQQAAQGSDEALETLLMEVGGPMLRTVRRALGANHPSVEDVAQEAALGLAKSISSFRGECSVTHFAVRVALRTALHARRHLGVRSRVGDFSAVDFEVIDEHADSPLDMLISQERLRIVRHALDQLAEPIAEALALHFMLGLTIPEIAEAEGLSVNTIWSRLRLGKQALRKMFVKDERLADLLQHSRGPASLGEEAL